MYAAPSHFCIQVAIAARNPLVGVFRILVIRWTYCNQVRMPKAAMQSHTTSCRAPHLSTCLPKSARMTAIEGEQVTEDLPEELKAQACSLYT